MAPARYLVVAFVCLLSLANSVSSLSLRDGAVSRRDWLQKSLVPVLVPFFSSSSVSAADLAKEAKLPADTAPEQGRSSFPALTPPFRNRATYRYTLGRNAWAFEQLLTFVNVTATIRSNVLLLQDGSLWVHSPQYPTGELCYLLDQLGPVKHVVLPCNALEHKALMKAFVKRYPDASVWITPGQYGPFGECGSTLKDCRMPYRVDGILGTDIPPWADEFDMALLYASLPENAGPVSEVAFCHRPTKTLVATDAVVYVPSDTPNIFSTYFDARTIEDYPSFWPKSVLQAVFLPLRVDQHGKYYPGYEAIQQRLVRAPILRAFADARAPNEVRQWVQTISTFSFDRILTSHFASPISATPQEFKDAFGYLFGELGKLPPIACQDWELLETLNQFIEQNKLGAPVVFDFQKGCLVSKE